MIENTSKKSIKYIWGLSLRESIAVTFFGVLIAVSKMAIKVPLNIPGHSGFLWIGILTICCLTFQNGRSGTLAGIISGVLVVIMFPGKEGILTFFKYFVPGITMDMLFSFIPVLTSRWYTTALTASLCHLTKLAVNFTGGLILNLPMGFLVMGLKIAVIYHFFFGFAGGVLGYLIYSRAAIKNIRTLKLFE